MDEQDKILYFMKGLKTYTARRVQESRANTLDECIEIASSIELSYEIHSQPHTPGPRTSHLNRNNFSNSTFHPRKTSTSERVETIQCFKCKRVGHYASKCNFNSPKFASGNTVPNKTEHNFNRTENSQHKVHSTSQVPPSSYSRVDQSLLRPSLRTPQTARMVSTNSPLLDIQGTLNDINLTFILDTGANISLLSESWVQRNNIPKIA